MIRADLLGTLLLGTPVPNAPGGTRNTPQYRAQTGLMQCVRVCPNGDRTYEPRLPEHVQEWREYNAVMRFGCAQFVNGECVYPGHCPDDVITATTAFLTENPTHGTR